MFFNPNHDLRLEFIFLDTQRLFKQLWWFPGGQMGQPGKLDKNLFRTFFSTILIFIHTVFWWWEDGVCFGFFGHPSQMFWGFILVLCLGFNLVPQRGDCAVVHPLPWGLTPHCASHRREELLSWCSRRFRTPLQASWSQLEPFYASVLLSDVQNCCSSSARDSRSLLSPWRL